MPASDVVSEHARQFYLAMRSQPPVRLPLRAEDQAASERARLVRFGPAKELAARIFGEEAAPVVALMHGWGGQGTQLYRMALGLAEAGFQAVVIDFGNHGDSAPMALGFDRFMIDAGRLAEYLGAMPFAWVGHSAAALAFMSARRTHGLSAQAYVTIAAPFVPYVPLNRFRSMGAGEDAVDMVKPLLAQEFQTDWASLEAGQAWLPSAGADLLAIYDRDDTMVNCADADRIAEVWPGLHRLETEGLGHNRILGAADVITETVRFLSEARPKVEA